MHINPCDISDTPVKRFSHNRAKILLKVVVLLFICHGACAAHAGWTPSFREFVGVNNSGTTNPLFTNSLSYDRDDIYWDSLAPASNTWSASVLTNWGQTVLALQGQNVRFLPMLGYTAQWAADKSTRSWTNGSTVWTVSSRAGTTNMDYFIYTNGVLASQSILTNLSKFPAANVNEWSNYVYRVTTFLHAPPYNVQYFQVWNEASKVPGFWYGSMNEYMQRVHLPAAQAIRAAGGKVVYGGWPTADPFLSHLLNLLDTNNAWGSLDVLDMHYYNFSDLQTLRSGADSRGFTNMPIWQSEVGFTSNYTYIANYYPRALYWNLSNNWTQDKYQAFYFANYAPDATNAYGYHYCLYSGTPLSNNGIVLTNLASVLGGTNQLSQYPGVTSSPALLPATGNGSSMEAFSYMTNIAVVIHLTRADFTNNSSVTLYLPIAPGNIISAARVDLSGATSNLLTDLACQLTASGVGSQLTVSTRDAAGSLAESWNALSGVSVFYVLINTGTNLALRQPVTVSSIQSTNYPESNAVDGDQTTRWSSYYPSDPQWIYLDLGATYDITRTKLNWETAYAKSYQIQVSSDTLSWTTIYSTTNGNGGIDDLTGLSGSGRYVRMYGTQRGTSYGYSLYEFEVYGVPFSLSLNQPATASSLESANYPANNAADGNAATRWSSASSDPQWICVDLGATYNIAQVTLNWEAAYAKNYQIQVSPDATNWVTICNVTNGNGGIDDLTGLSGSGRYVRMYGTVRGTPWGYSLYEFSVYGTIIQPTGLTATAGQAQAFLAWDGVSGATTYNVKRSTTSGGPYTIITNISSTSFIDTSAINGVTYYYVVSALNVAGESYNSAQVSVTLNLIPPPWTSQDIGAVGLTGGATYINGLFTLTGSGADIWSGSDAFQSVFQTGSSDCSIQAKVLAIQNTHAFAKGGVMIRESLNANSTMASTYVTPTSGVQFIWRTTTGGNAVSTTVAGITAPIWVKATRTGNSFVGYYSTNGANWQAISTNTITMATNVDIGLIVCAHNNATNCTTTFTNVVATP